MVSTMSAWCSASRAAHEIASDGMLRASGSRWRGRRLPAPRMRVGQPAVDGAADQPGEADEEHGEDQVEGEVEADDLLVHRGQQLLQQDVHLRQEDDEEDRAEQP